MDQGGYPDHNKITQALGGEEYTLAHLLPGHPCTLQVLIPRAFLGVLHSPLGRTAALCVPLWCWPPAVTPPHLEMLLLEMLKQFDP